jgi:hypothetical protein
VTLWSKGSWNIRGLEGKKGRILGELERDK